MALPIAAIVLPWGAFRPMTSAPMKQLSSWSSLFLLVGPGLAADELQWHPDANMDTPQLFPSLLIATATQRPNDKEEENEPDPESLGDPYGSVGVSIQSPKAGTKVRVTLLENGVMNKSTWSGVLEEADLGLFHRAEGELQIRATAKGAAASAAERDFHAGGQRQERGRADGDADAPDGQ